MNTRVVLAESPDYQPDHVSAAVRQCLASLGGLDSYIRPGQKVLLQVNLISARPSKDAVCTHPSVVAAMCRLVREAGGTAFVGGSAGGAAYQRTGHVFKVSGILDAAEQEGAKVLNYDELGGQDVQVAGALMTSVHLARPLLDADVLITLPKMKTHTLTLLTGAVKNHLGTLPGPRKAELHRRFPAPRLFGEALLDIYAAAPPRLAIMDAVEGMEGDGPTRGRVRQVGLIAASADGVALDAVMCAICGLDPRWVPTLVAAGRRGVGTSSLDSIEVVGPSLELTKLDRPFAFPATYRLMAHSWLPLWVGELFAKHIGGSPKPYVNRDRCNGCQLCVKSCPQQAITATQKRARIDQSHCISCFCCHEVCIQQAIDVRLPLLWRMLRL